MCTVSWSFKNQSYRLFFNRDEQRSRPRAAPPRIVEHDGAKLIAPIDPQAGGTWIAVNEMGNVAFLLNHYAATKKGGLSDAYQSRGEIPLIVAAKGDFESSLRAIEDLDRERYSPFFVGVLTPSGQSCLYSWDGGSLREVDLEERFLTTSSFRSEEVQRYRREWYREMIGSNEEVEAWDRGLDYHKDTSHSDLAFNPLMSREDAETQCVSMITADPSGVEFEYRERISDEVALGPRVTCSFEK